MEASSTDLAGVLLLKPRVFEDERGFFMESYQAQTFAEMGITLPFVQDNQSGSRQGVLRGLHYQMRHPQGKLVRVLAGEIYDVAVDLRRSSSSFGRWLGVRLSAENRLQLWVPVGFAHGFYALSAWAEVLYKTTDFYDPQGERTLLWSDPAMNVAWPLVEGKPPLLSAKDAKGLPLVQAEVFD
jgi:dTDP-4-dehydrorhamnose 3,5-epimerase